MDERSAKLEGSNEEIDEGKIRKWKPKGVEVIGQLVEQQARRVRIEGSQLKNTRLVVMSSD